MSLTLGSKVQTAAGEVTVVTKTRFLFLFQMARTSVMPIRFHDLGRDGVQFRWATNDPSRLEQLHNHLVQSLGEGITLADLRGIAEIGKRLLVMGLPFIPEDAPLPESLKLISNDIKSVL